MVFACCRVAKGRLGELFGATCAVKLCGSERECGGSTWWMGRCWLLYRRKCLNRVVVVGL